jgi:hypothetical protein
MRTTSNIRASSMPVATTTDPEMREIIAFEMLVFIFFITL